MIPKTKFFPQWTRRVVTEGSGRDPLGLSRVSDLLTDYLLPGIITTTNRARYYSFYSWVISDVSAAKAVGGKRFSFETEFQRREAAFAMASSLAAKTDLTIVGTDTLKGKLAEAVIDGTADTGFRVLLDPLGGFGNYYRGCLQILQLVRYDDDGDWAVSENRGEALAKAFAAATRKAPYLSGDWRQRERVPLDVLAKSGVSFSLDALRTTGAAEERALLTEMFFSLDQKPQPLTPLNRQATLGQLLHVLRCYADAGLEVTRSNADWAALFWPHYYGCLAEPEGRPRRYESPPEFANVHGFWKQFCAHQFLAFALEELLAAVVDALTPYPQGLHEPELLDVLVTDELLEDLSEALGRKCARPADALGAAGVKAIPNKASSSAVKKRFGAAAKLNEWAVCWDPAVGPQTRLGRAVTLLTLLYGKWRGDDEDAAFRSVQERAAGDLSVSTLFPRLDGWLREKPDWRSAVTQLLEWLLRRHEQVKFQKRKLEASWFEVVDNRWVRQQSIKPTFRASRYRNMMTILQDLALLEDGQLDEPLILTREGRRVLGKVIRLRE